MDGQRLKCRLFNVQIGKGDVESPAVGPELAQWRATCGTVGILPAVPTELTACRTVATRRRQPAGVPVASPLHGEGERLGRSRGSTLPPAGASPPIGTRPPGHNGRTERHSPTGGGPSGTGG